MSAENVAVKAVIYYCKKKKANGAFYSIVVGPSWRDKTCCNGSFDLLLKSLVKQYINIKSWLFWKLWTMNTF